MNYKLVGKFIAHILSIEVLFMLPAIAISLHDNDSVAIKAFLYTFLIFILCIALLYLFARNQKVGFYAKEGLVCVGLGWIALGIMGCLPFYISKEIPFFIDAFFETVSGFTTTGASILTNVEGLSRGMLYWRSFTHWLGGMGILVFLLVFIPSTSNGFTMHIMRAESPGPNVGKLVPRMRQTAIILYSLYILLTVLDVTFLLFGGLPLFDSVCIAFGTAGTGGFGILNSSIASYSPYIQNVCTVFMILFGFNFGCYYLLLLGGFKAFFSDEELRLYIGIILVSITLIVLNLASYYPTLEETIRHAAFQVASIMTTTGFATTDFDLWPSFSKAILLCLMMVGACAGSTGGGLKCGRLLLLVKILLRNIKQVLRPNEIQAIRVNKQLVDERVLSNTNAYLAAYVLIVLTSFLIISVDGFSMITNFSAVIACFNNIGPGFETVGATCNYASFSPFSKIVLIINMLAGRLEIFPILVLFNKNVWIRR